MSVKSVGTLMFCVLVLLGLQVLAQETPNTKPIPVLTGVFSYQSSFEPGTQEVAPEFDPILLVPLGNKFLVESEFEMSMDVTRDQGRVGPAVVEHGIEYLQLDYVANPYLTVVAGRFLTPFGIYRERLHPMWIRNLAAEPIIFAMNDNSSNGAMLRGAAPVTSGMNITYAGYFSAPLDTSQLQSDRRAGTRVSLVFPNKRFEAGVSFSRVLSGNRYNMVGSDVTWNVRRIPVDLRAEFVYSNTLGTGYWIEGAYRFDRFHNAFLRNSQIVARMEQYRVPNLQQSLIDELPDSDTNRAAIGWNYTLYNGIRVDASYGRNFAKEDNHNTWTVGVSYRFAIF